MTPADETNDDSTPGLDSETGAGEPDSEEAAPEPVLGRPYDPAPKREQVRGWLAFLFSVLIGIMALAPTVAVIAGWASWADLEGPVTLTLGPIAGLVGTVLGFYFGSQRND